MYRNGAILSLVIGSLLVFNLAFTPFDKVINQWEYDSDGNPHRVTIQCDTPWNLVVNDTYLTTDPAWHGSRCLPSARILMIEGGIVTAAALALAFRGFRNGKRPATKSVRELPQLERLDS